MLSAICKWFNETLAFEFKEEFHMQIESNTLYLKPIKNDQKMINNKSCDHRLGSRYVPQNILLTLNFCCTYFMSLKML